jgi:two-component system sensor histidine kinase BaeS
MREQTGRLRRLADDVEVVSRAEERQADLRLRPVDLCEVADEAIRAAAAAFRDKGVTLRRQGLAVGAYADADPDRLREVLDNLLANALRHTPAGGTVTTAPAPTPSRGSRRRRRRRHRRRTPPPPVQPFLPGRPRAGPRKRR